MASFTVTLPSRLFRFVVFRTYGVTNVRITCRLEGGTTCVVTSSTPMMSPKFAPVCTNDVSYLLRRGTSLREFTRGCFRC